MFSVTGVFVMGCQVRLIFFTELFFLHLLEFIYFVETCTLGNKLIREFSLFLYQKCVPFYFFRKNTLRLLLAGEETIGVITCSRLPCEGVIVYHAHLTQTHKIIFNFITVVTVCFLSQGVHWCA